MAKHSLLKIGSQKDVISLADGKKYVDNWHEFIKGLYRGKKKHMPHGIFIPLMDIEELAKLRKSVKHIHVKEKGSDKPKKKRIYIVGIRAYFCLKQKLMIPTPVWAADYPIAAILVAVYQTNKRRPGSKGEYQYDDNHSTHDLIVPIPSVQDIDVPGDAEAYSIYDVTQPCPNLCDTESELF
jgi:hypothetical protein